MNKDISYVNDAILFSNGNRDDFILGMITKEVFGRYGDFSPRTLSIINLTKDRFDDLDSDIGIEATINYLITDAINDLSKIDYIPPQTSITPYERAMRLVDGYEDKFYIGVFADYVRSEFNTDGIINEEGIEIVSRMLDTYKTDKHYNILNYEGLGDLRDYVEINQNFKSASMLDVSRIYSKQAQIGF